MSLRLIAVAVVSTLVHAAPAMAIDLAPLWDFSRPDISEQRFRAALATASGDDAVILQTQIARSFGLRRDFAQAQALLKSIEAQAQAAGPEARVRYALELGRSHASATHPPATLTDEAKATARRAFGEALERARAAGLDGLAIDAIHMFAFIDTAPVDQLKWTQQALAVVEASTQPAAKAWEASIRNNLGMALHGLGRFDEALVQFKQALAVRERGGNAERVRVAHWMVAWTLRAMKRHDEALAIQLRLEREGAAAGQPDPYVFEELELLYRDQGDAVRAASYAERRKALAK
jgi:tetratricopeptide (TPR) repeat protein